MFPTLDRANAADFSRPIYRASWAVVIPIETGSNMWYFIDPFTYDVWLPIAIGIPIYIIVMGLANYFYLGSGDWNTLSGFIVRNALSEQNSKLPDHASARVYQKILIITLLWCALVLVQAYSGNLTAMLAKPKLEAPIRNLEELLNQDEISWVIEGKTSVDARFMSTAAPGSVMNLLYKRATFVPKLNKTERIKYGCHAAKMMGNGRVGSICGGRKMLQMIANDFSTTGKCNFYIIEDRLMSQSNSMAFQVRYICNASYYLKN